MRHRGKARALRHRYGHAHAKTFGRVPVGGLFQYRGKIGVLEKYVPFGKYYMRTASGDRLIVSGVYLEEVR